MRYQETSYWCGPASLSAATRALGAPISQRKAALIGGCDAEGMDEIGIKRCLLACGYAVDMANFKIGSSAKTWLTVNMRLGRPTILCINQWTHWICVLGMLGNRFIIFDPGRWDYRVNSGVVLYSWDRLKRRWMANKRTRGTDDPYFGIGVGKPQK